MQVFPTDEKYCVATNLAVRLIEEKHTLASLAIMRTVTAWSGYSAKIFMAATMIRSSVLSSEGSTSKNDKQSMQILLTFFPVYMDPHFNTTVQRCQ